MTDLPAQVFADYSRFVEIAPHIMRGCSLASVAENVKLSINTVKDTIRRIETRSGCSLVEYADRNHGTNSLTDAGKKLYDQLADLLRQDFLGPESPLRLAVSSTLMNNLVLPPAIASYRDELRKNHIHASPVGHRLRLSVASSNTLQSIVESLQKKILDMAFVWGCDIRQEFAGIKNHKMDFLFDVVFVSWEMAKIERIQPASHYDAESVPWNELERACVALIPRLTQPHRSKLEFTDVANGGERIPVDTFETAIACVKSRVADYAVVPAVYPDLERSKQDGTLYFSRPISQVALSLLVREKIYNDDSIQHFIEHVEGFLRSHKCRYQPIRATKPNRIPEDVEFFELLRYGYYLERKNGPPMWKSERVEFRLDGRKTREKKSSDDRGVFIGTIRNQEELPACFEVKAKILNDAFVVEARRVGPEIIQDGEDSSVLSFVSLFSLAWVDKGVIWGTWTGWSRNGNEGSESPVLYGTLLSQNELTVNEIDQYCRSAELESAIRSDYFAPSIGSHSEIQSSH